MKLFSQFCLLFKCTRLDTLVILEQKFGSSCTGNRAEIGNFSKQDDINVPS